MRIAVGPAPAHWDTSKLRSLYRELADGPADRVYLGETTCPHRSRFAPDLLAEACGELRRASKEVYASSPVLVRKRDDRRPFELLARRAGRIEINSPAFLRLARRYPAVSGAFLNVCNAAAADILVRHSIESIVLPFELGLASIASIARGCRVPVEVAVHGYIPIAVSQTCLTARALGRNGDGCGASCRRYPEGMTLEAGARPLFRIEGPQTLSAATYCLVEHLPHLERAGVDTVRILPQWDRTSRVVQVYRDVLDGRTACTDAAAELEALSPEGLCNGWLLGKAGWTYESPN